MTDRETWADWLLNRQFGGDAALRTAFLERYLQPIGERILARTALAGRQRLLDVGCGMGLLGLLGLNEFDETEVLFSDPSATALDWLRRNAVDDSALHRCRFICAEAQSLPLREASIDAVVNRAVLIYIEDRFRVLKEYHRVLRPGGRVSLFEPVMQFACTEPAHRFWGFDVSAVAAIAGKLKRVYHRAQPSITSRFDEPELWEHAVNCGFREVHTETRHDLAPLLSGIPWETLIRIECTPMLPSLHEAMTQCLADDERAEFIACLRPLVETNRGIQRWAAVYMWAIK